MTRIRPSDLYRLPAHNRAAADEDDGTPHRPRWPAMVGIGVLLLLGLGLVGAPGAEPDAPVVDVVNEDQAIAALALYAAEAGVLDDLGAREDIFAAPGPPEAVRVLTRGIESTADALGAAREQQGPDRLVAEYWYAAEHEQFLDQLHQTLMTTRQLSLLAATHDSLYGGTGSIGFQEAQHQLASEFQSTTNAGTLSQWAETLLRAIDGADAGAQAATLREEARNLWPTVVAQLKPLPAEEALRTYVAGLPRTTVEGLRGHPVAGPALERLEQP